MMAVSVMKKGTLFWQKAAAKSVVSLVYHTYPKIKEKTKTHFKVNEQKVDSLDFHRRISLCDRKQ